VPHLTNKRVKRLNISAHVALQKFATNFYNWVNTTGRQPTPGAEAFAFAKQMLPLYDWKGPGEIVQEQLRAYGGPQVFIPQSVVPTGIAGIQAGQIFLAELMANPADPNTE
jgi:hypothetical protein